MKQEAWLRSHAIFCLSELLGKPEHWPILLSTTCIPAFMQLAILPWFPESPRYLLLDKGDDTACTKGTSPAERPLTALSLHIGFSFQSFSEELLSISAYPMEKTFIAIYSGKKGRRCFWKTVEAYLRISCSLSE